MIGPFRIPQAREAVRLTWTPLRLNALSGAVAALALLLASHVTATAHEAWYPEVICQMRAER
jgi:hypothetical protein